jgi:hypothetical protein
MSTLASPTKPPKVQEPRPRDRTALSGAGVLTAAGFLATAAIHFALANYGRDLDAAAAQALNALDADSFVPLTTCIAAAWIIVTSMVLYAGGGLSAAAASRDAEAMTANQMRGHRRAVTET